MHKAGFLCGQPRYSPDTHLQRTRQKTFHQANCPLTTPGTYFIVCASVKKPAGFSSISLTMKPAPVSTPFDKIPVSKGPVKQPTDRRTTEGSSLIGSGLGKAILGGPLAPLAASWI